VTRPEEATEAITEAPGHDVKVEVRHALADHFVDGKEGAFGAQDGALGGGYFPPGVDEWPKQVQGSERERRVVLARHDKGVAIEDRPVVQEGGDGRLVEHEVRR
jgi:hypothetical protein